MNSETSETKTENKTESKTDSKMDEAETASVSASASDAKSAEESTNESTDTSPTIAKSVAKSSIKSDSDSSATTKTAKPATAKSAKTAKTEEVKPTPLDVKEAVDKLRMHSKDVGSPQVQIARLTARIAHLTSHLRIHKKDKHTRRGLIALISRRRKLTAYLKRIDLSAHRQVLSTLGLRK